jgi:hypothetical protein
VCVFRFRGSFVRNSLRGKKPSGFVINVDNFYV